MVEIVTPKKGLKGIVREHSLYLPDLPAYLTYLPTWSTYLPDLPDRPTYLTYLRTWPTYPTYLPTGPSGIPGFYVRQNPGIFETEIPGIIGICCHCVFDPLEHSYAQNRQNWQKYFSLFIRVNPVPKNPGIPGFGKIPSRKIPGLKILIPLGPAYLPTYLTYLPTYLTYLTDLPIYLPDLPDLPDKKYTKKCWENPKSVIFCSRVPEQLRSRLVIFSDFGLGQPKRHFFDTFLQFWPWRGPKRDKTHL